MRSDIEIKGRLEAVMVALERANQNGAQFIANPVVRERLDSARRTLLWVLGKDFDEAE